MLRKLTFTALMLLAIAGGTLAQGDSRVAHPLRRVTHPISSVEVADEGGKPVLIVSGELPDGCTAPAMIESQRVGEAWFVDIYRELPFDRECTAVVVPYEQRIDAAGLLQADGRDELASVVVVNSRLYGVEAAGAEGALPTLNPLMVRGVLPFDGVMTRHTTDGDMEITLTGTLTDGCAIPVYRAVPDWQNEGFVTVEAYTAIPLNAACMQIARPFELAFGAPVFDSLAVNGIGIPFDPAISVDTQPFFVMPVALTDVTAAAAHGSPRTWLISVSGYVDGCDYPVQIVPQEIVDDTQRIVVVRVLPAGIACPAIAVEFTQEFQWTPPAGAAGSFTLRVGDFTVELDLSE